MMNRVIQVFIALPGVMMGLSAVGWLTNPQSAAEGLGMQLLDGVGRSTQVGDMTSFFAVVSIMVLVGAIRQNATWLVGPVLLLGGAAVFRTLAWMVICGWESQSVLLDLAVQRALAQAHGLGGLLAIAVGELQGHADVVFLHLCRRSPGHEAPTVMVGRSGSPDFRG